MNRWKCYITQVYIVKERMNERSQGGKENEVFNWKMQAAITCWYCYNDTETCKSKRLISNWVNNSCQTWEIVMEFSMEVEYRINLIFSIFRRWTLDSSISSRFHVSSHGDSLLSFVLDYQFDSYAVDNIDMIMTCVSIYASRRWTYE